MLMEINLHRKVYCMSTTNITLAALVVAATTFFCPCGNHEAAADGHDEDKTTLEVSLDSRYVFRGTAVTDGVGVSSSLTTALASNNLGTTSFNLWGHTPIAGDFSEIDFSLSQGISDIATLTLTSYYYGGNIGDIDSHDIEATLAGNFGGVDVAASRVLSSDTIEGDTYVELGYCLDDWSVFAGVGDGAYSEAGDFAPVNVGFSYSPPSRGRGRWGTGYSASLIYNPSTENTFLVASKRW